MSVVSLEAVSNGEGDGDAVVVMLVNYIIKAVL